MTAGSAADNGRSADVPHQPQVRARPGPHGAGPFAFLCPGRLATSTSLLLGLGRSRCSWADRCRRHDGHLGAGTPFGDRSAPVARRYEGQVRTQFVAESLLLSLIGGAAGALLGYLVTGTYATIQKRPTVVPLRGLAGGVGETVLIGAIAGLYPAIRASRLAPTEALAAT
ncbi:ABC transporter permease [Nonomuraea sp. NPDC049480]|uniref:ABC transporter permease n=1 Tax=Nonomuraea sp. NPDC049480 TaxID=3364353 RepID=UPI0037AB3A8F